MVVLIVLLAVAVLAPIVVEAQHSASHPRIGFLGTASLSEPRVLPFLKAFQQSLRALNYVEGQNIAIEFRSAEGQYDRLPGLAAELARLKVNVIVAAGSPAVRAAKRATEAIPIVMVGVADPIAAGFAASLARPGANITGPSLMVPDLVGKQLGLLREISSQISRVALLGNPTNPSYAPLLQYAQAAAPTLGIALQPLEARDAREIDIAFAAITTERAGAVIVLQDTALLDHRTRLADHALQRRLPMVSGASQFAEAGGLLTYGPSLADDFRRAALYVDRILKGAKPAEVPIEQPVTFELVINLRTTKTIGLAIPRSVLLRADRVIE